MKVDVTSLDAVIFDLGGVILNLDYNLTIDAFKNLGGDRFDELYTQANQSKIIDSFEIGESTSQDFINYLLQFLPEVKDPKVVMDAWNVMLLDLPSRRIDFLKRIGKDKRIFLFSNTNEIHYNNFRYMLKEVYGNDNLLETLFEKTYYSHIAGKRKPNSDAFKLVIDENNLDISRTLFIDDSIQHIKGANELGIQTYHLVDEDVVDIFTFG
jgi:putative hydrolase of the HAD superfamily